MNLIGEQHQPLRIPGRCPTLRGITGAPLHSQGLGRIRMTCEDGNDLDLSGAIVEGKTLLLGLPFLMQNGASVDFRSGWLEMRGRPLPLTQNYKAAVVRQVKVEDEVTWEDKAASSIFSEEGRRQFLELINAYSETWSESVERTSRPPVEHEILLTSTKPVRCAPRKYSEMQRKVIDEEVARMLEAGVIRESKAPYASAVVLVKKKTDEWRFCVDYRPLNEMTILDSYPLPRIKDMLSAVKKSRYFIALDLKAGYWQVPMKAASIPKTAFRTHRGLYEFLVMPFGLTNAPATFQRLMDQLLGDLYWLGVLVYLDDILIHAETEAESLRLFKTVLERLSEAGLRINKKKSEVAPQAIDYLGHSIGEGTIRPLAGRIAALRDLRSPTSVKQVRQVLGMLGYYREFIPDYAIIAGPLFDTLKGTKKQKPTIFEWTASHEEAFRTLLQLLGQFVLTSPCDGEVLEVTTDASTKGIGAVLEVAREGKKYPIEFLSKRFTEVEARWATREQEAFAIIYALRKWEGYLRGRRVIVTTDHKSLEWLLESKTGKLARWAMTLGEYDLKIQHRAGSLLCHVDALSRLDSEPAVEERMIFGLRQDEKRVDLETMREATRAEHEKGQLEVPASWCEGLILVEGKIYVPRGMREAVYNLYHDSWRASHPGGKRTESKIRRSFYWPTLRKDVVKWIQSCLFCQRTRVGKEKYHGRPRTHPVPLPFQTVYMDHFELHQGVEVLTMMDYATRWVEARVCRNRSGQQVRKHFHNEWLCRYGAPSLLITDNDLAFCSQEMEDYWASLGIRHVRATPYHPQGNAPIESWHRHLNRVRVQTDKSGPHQAAIQTALLGYRSSFHTALRDTPARVTYGLDIFVPGERGLANLVGDLASDRVKVLTQTRAHLLDEMKRRITMGKIQTDTSNISVGDLVLVKEARKTSKSDYAWSLPMRVLMRSEGRCRCQCLLTGQFVERNLTHLRKICPPTLMSQYESWMSQLRELGPQIAKEDLDVLLGEPSLRQQELREAFRQGNDLKRDSGTEQEMMPAEATIDFGSDED